MCGRARYQLETRAVSEWIQMAATSLTSMSLRSGVFDSAIDEIQTSNRGATFFRSDMENDVGPLLVTTVAIKPAEVASLFL